MLPSRKTAQLWKYERDVTYNLENLEVRKKGSLKLIII